MQPPNNNNDNIKIKDTFYPLFNMLDVYNIPHPPRATTINLAEHRDYIIKSLYRCIISIRQENLPINTGGILITSRRTVYVHEPNGTTTSYDSFRLNILINSSICHRGTYLGRLWFKLTVVHEFIHAIASLSAISRVRSDILINNLMAILQEKTEALNYNGIASMLIYLSEPLLSMLQSKRNGIPRRWHFDDKHFRLGFEDVKGEYPLIFEEFLLPTEIIERNIIPSHLLRIMLLSFRRNDTVFRFITTRLLRRIRQNESLPKEFIYRRFFINFFLPKVK